MTQRHIFITGTDTGVGKTVVALAILEAARDAGVSTIALKPVAAGGEQGESGFENEDAQLLRAAASVELAYTDVNPVALEPAIAPHIAAQQIGLRLDAAGLVAHCRRFDDAALVLIEGAGGWLVPLNATETMADVCIGLDAEVLLVVDMKLGCISHTLLTAGAIRNAGLQLAGWVANSTSATMPALEDNLSALRERLDAPCIATIPFQDSCSVRKAAEYIDLGALGLERA